MYQKSMSQFGMVGQIQPRVLELDRAMPLLLSIPSRKNIVKGHQVQSCAIDVYNKSLNTDRRAVARFAD